MQRSAADHSSILIFVFCVVHCRQCYQKRALSSRLFVLIASLALGCSGLCCGCSGLSCGSWCLKRLSADNPPSIAATAVTSDTWFNPQQDCLLTVPSQLATRKSKPAFRHVAGRAYVQTNYFSWKFEYQQALGGVAV